MSNRLGYDNIGIGDKVMTVKNLWGIPIGSNGKITNKDLESHRVCIKFDNQQELTRMSIFTFNAVCMLGNGDMVQKVKIPNKYELIKDRLRSNSNITFVELQPSYFQFVEEQEDGYHNCVHHCGFLVYSKQRVGNSDKERFEFAKSLMDPLVIDRTLMCNDNMVILEHFDKVGQRVIEATLTDEQLKHHSISAELIDGHNRVTKDLYRIIEIRLSSKVGR